MGVGRFGGVGASGGEGEDWEKGIWVKWTKEKGIKVKGRSLNIQVKWDRV